MMKFLVTGGGGYIGFHISLKLLELDHQVLLLDICYPSKKWDTSLSIINNEEQQTNKIHCSFGKMEFIKGDVRDVELLLRITQNIDCVIHTASYGMSGSEQMPPHWDKIEDININGTRNILNACYQNRVRGLVYTSTYNVVFGGQVIRNGDESLPYFPLHRHVDHYSRTKSIAEQLVLTSNGRGELRTCALRLAGVIGRGETRHIPRIVKAIRGGLVRFDYYDQYGGIVDFVGIENVVQSHVKAALKLCSSSNNVAGQAYFISDGRPVNNLEYFQPLIEGLGQPFPRLKLPLWIMYLVVVFVDFVHGLLYRFNVDFTPILTHAELYKTSVTHHFSIAKAEKDFSYKPVQYDVADIAAEYK